MTASTTPSSAQTYQLDPAHSSAHFSVRHMMIATVRGEFSKLEGSLTYDPAHPEAAHVEVTIDAGSINTHEAQRDTHLKSADFFDVAQFPTLTFRSTKVTPDQGGAGQIEGDLTIHGATRPVVLQLDEASPEVKDPWGNFRMAFAAHAKIRRSDFGLAWNAALEAGGVLVGDDISITLDVQFTRPGQ